MPIVIDMHPGPDHKMVNIDDDSQSIYRVLDPSHLFDLFETKSLALVPPRMWEDPYENVFADSFGVDQKNKKVRYSYEGYVKNIFGICWTLIEETDASWRIYSPEKNRIKIKTSLKKLSKVVTKLDEDFFQSRIGKVKYYSEKTIKRNISDIINKLSNFGRPDLIEELYLIKRNVFKHEKEVRLLVRLPQVSGNEIHSLLYFSGEEEVCIIPVDNPNDFVEEIVFDPRMPNNLVRVYEYYLKNHFGYPNTICMSNMYEGPNVRIKVKDKWGIDR